MPQLDWRERWAIERAAANDSQAHAIAEITVAPSKRGHIWNPGDNKPLTSEEWARVHHLLDAGERLRDLRTLSHERDMTRRGLRKEAC